MRATFLVLLLLLAAAGVVGFLAAPEPSALPDEPAPVILRPEARAAAPAVTYQAPAAAGRVGPAKAPAGALPASAVEATTPAASAGQLATHLVASDRGGDVMALGAAVQGDGEMAPLLEAEARRLTTGSDPLLRARGVLILVALGTLDVASWREAVAREGDAAARLAMVESPPLTGRDPKADADVARALLDVADRDGEATVRVAALRALPRGLDGDQVASVVRRLREDRDPSVRRMAASWLRGARLADPAAVRALLAAASASSEEREVRRASATALLRIEERTPGTLVAAGTSMEALEKLLEVTADDQG